MLRKLLSSTAYLDYWCIVIVFQIQFQIWHWQLEKQILLMKCLNMINTNQSIANINRVKLAAWAQSKIYLSKYKLDRLYFWKVWSKIPGLKEWDSTNIYYATHSTMYLFELPLCEIILNLKYLLRLWYGSVLYTHIIVIYIPWITWLRLINTNKIKGFCHTST